MTLRPSSTLTLDIITATTPDGDPIRGLISCYFEGPRYLWTELLTYRREICRNASSHRATKTVTDIYRPTIWYLQGVGMSSSDIPVVNQEEVFFEWGLVLRALNRWSEFSQSRSIAKEQWQRLLPTSSYIHGVITASYREWMHIVNQRTHPTADRSMREMFEGIGLSSPVWTVADVHVPYVSGEVAAQMGEGAALAHAAQLARISYGRIVSRGEEDLDLAARLIVDGHMSPFEHLNRWNGTRWVSLREILEGGQRWGDGE